LDESPPASVVADVLAHDKDREGMSGRASPTPRERRSERRLRLRNNALRLGTGSEIRQQIISASDLHGERSRQVIYFCRIGNAIKIGETSAFRSRAKEHNRRRPPGCTGNEFEVLAVVHGHRKEEDAIKRYFADYALPRESEWFQLAPALLEYIRWLRDLSFVAVGEEEPGGLPQDALVVPGESWLPTAERRKEPTSPLFGAAYFDRRVITGDDYYTPANLMALVREALVVIDLDPASHPVADQIVRARRFFQKTDNGLDQPWGGSVWLNPPFSEWPEFAEKIIAEVSSGRIEQLLALVSVPTLTASYLQGCLAHCDLIVILTGRLTFWGPQVENGNGAGPSSGHALLYFGKDGDRVRKTFQSLGTVFLKA